MNLCTKIKRAYHRATRLWTVRVEWTTRTIVHHAKDEADALEWADCYPLDATVTIVDFQVPRLARLASRDGAWVRLS